MATGRMLGGDGDAPVPERARTRAQFKPGTVGVAFAQPIPTDVGDLAAFACEALGDFGLAIDPDSGSIGGVPTVPGEYTVTICARRDAEPVEIDATIIVNADPRTLWRTIEPPAEAAHPKPHCATLRVAGDLTIVGASKRGRSHAHGGAFREDHFGARVAGAWHLLAVADGAGSAALSRLGSRIAVEAALDALEAAIPPATDKTIATVLATAARAAAQALDARAAADAIDRRALSTTLILAAVRRIEAGILTAVLGIGDGGAGIVAIGADPPCPLTVPDGGEFAGQTRFLDQAAGDERRVRIDIRAAFSALLLMTDGITDPYLPTEAAFASGDRWRILWQDIGTAVDLRSPAADTQLLAWLDFWSHGNHDDRTILVLIP